ncbi:DNA polymerase III subunit beta [Aureimonas phyllosphaerae]|uniref:Beta sliding clamp n=1 Tax=Aureimonas phyllosphaerae TaxID=1166078 RepID=A0A7W6BZZ9_9HYPH|nr:DNA polymerase III subunit beta [Aureimonas phyllosphaerae]MBB3937900.1 DNA polymerase-3 subunit beta [Aureimonas phyllosphaerae]MBB3961927.1 DNA polymerase-3 subunit beta [Aureimonas phyllosphaerae]SFF54752.1 DNA polymerase-3 subunit beta [Aureimonas phyllosphaerae]
MSVAFTVPQDVLLRLVSRVELVIEKRNTIPILSNVLVSANGDGSLSVEGTDLDIWIRMEADPGAADVSVPGSTTVPAGLLKDILRKLGKGDVRFANDGRFATITSGKARFNLNELPPEDFPDITGVNAKQASEFEVWPGSLTAILSDVGFATSTEETRYYLNGVYLHPVEVDGVHKLAAVATDGHRLSKLVQGVEGEIAEMKGVIVHNKTLRLFKSMAEWCPEGERVAITCDEFKVMFSAGGFRLVSKLIDGTFPDYTRVIPGGNPNSFIVSPAALRAAVDRVSTVSSERGRAATFGIDNERLDLTVRSPDAGEAREELTIQSAGDFALEIGFNAKYVVDVLATFEAETLRFALGDAGSPALITNPADASRLVVLMPMRV